MNADLKRQIKDELVKRGMTQKELAAQIGISQGALANVLTGDRALLTPNAAKVLDALDLGLVILSKR